MSKNQKMALSDFELKRTLGVGSFGRVKYGKFKPNGEFYAVKFIKKATIIKLKQVDHIMAERNLMSQMNHPNIVNMVGSFHDPRFVYIVMECITGGEFFIHLRKTGRFNNEQSMFFAAQVAAAFEYIHGRNIVHRDLKPENLLLTTDGYLKLTDFGFAKVVQPDERTYTLCGTPEYIAPEVLLNKGHGHPVDWWTLGILIYEMIAGTPPFVDDDPIGIYKKILKGKLAFPRFFDSHAKALVKKLLTADLSKRYGNLKNGANDIKNHKWFASLNWQKLHDKQIDSPFKPSAKSSSELTNFSDIPDSTELPPQVPANQDPFATW